MDPILSTAKRAGLAVLVAAGFAMSIAVAEEGSTFKAIAWTIFSGFALLNLYLHARAP